MKAVYYDEMSDLERRMDDLMRSFFGQRLRLSRPVLPLFAAKPFVPVTDVFVRDEDLVVRVELPGMTPDDLLVTVEDGALVIRGERKHDEELDEKAYYRMEASYGAFERFIPLPERFEEAKIEAGYTDGVLEVIVPITPNAIEKPSPKAIPIKTTKPIKPEKKVA